MIKYDELEKLMLTLKVDLNKFHQKNNKAAGIRARKTLQDIKSISQEIRVEISEKRRGV